MTHSIEVARALADIVRAQETLMRLGVVRSQRTIPDFGEWFGCRLLGVGLCQSRTQKGWDIGSPDRRIQVKTHAKAPTNRALRTTLNKDELEFDELLVLVLAADYKVRDAFLVPRQDVERLAPLNGGKRILQWNKLENFVVRNIPSALTPLLA